MFLRNLSRPTRGAKRGWCYTSRQPKSQHMSRTVIEDPFMTHREDPLLLREGLLEPSRVLIGPRDSGPLEHRDRPQHSKDPLVPRENSLEPRGPQT